MCSSCVLFVALEACRWTTPYMYRVCAHRPEGLTVVQQREHADASRLVVLDAVGERLRSSWVTPRMAPARLALLLGLLGGLGVVDSARQCYELCMEIDPITNQFTGEIYEGAEAFCCTEPAGCGKEGTYSGVVPYGYMENLRCIAAMRKEPLEVYKWGRIPPKPDTRTLSEKIEGMDYGTRNRMCCSVDACSITDYRDCRRQQAADLEVLLAGRRLESAEEAYLLEEQHQAVVLDRLRAEISDQEHR